MRRPTLELAVVFNRAVRHDDEWFEEPDDLDRVERALAAIDGVHDPIEAAAVLAYRVLRAQGFGEGNKRTALLLARWLLDRNGVDGSAVIPQDDQEFADLLVRAGGGGGRRVGDEGFVPEPTLSAAPWSSCAVQRWTW